MSEGFTLPEELSTHPLAKIRIISDGTPRNTHVIDEVTGEEIHRIASIDFDFSVEDKYPKINLGIEMFNLDIVGGLKEIKVGGITYLPVIPLVQWNEQQEFLTLYS